jgi:hypothetical protein
MGSKNHPQMVGVFSFKRFTKNHLMNLHKYLMIGVKKQQKHRFLWKKTSEIFMNPQFWMVKMSIINLGWIFKKIPKSIIVHP